MPSGYAFFYSKKEIMFVPLCKAFTMSNYR